MEEIILKVDRLTKYFQTKKGTVHAVDGVTFDIKKGKTLGLVGESGCGKSTTGRVILRLLEATSGTVIFDGIDVTHLNKKKMKGLRKEMQMIFQDPYSSLNPRMSVSQLIAEPIRIHKMISGKDREQKIEKRVLELMETVGLAERLYNSYPHELDGGRRQRIVIARALSVNPKFIVCDEPVSALDVSIQAQILNLLKNLQEKLGLTYIFITHNLSVVSHFADEIAVMYLGSVVERAKTEELFSNPLHPYTQALLSAIPIPEIVENKKEVIISGEITSPINLPEECRFYQRCPLASENCKTGIPVLKDVGKGHLVACFKIQQLFVQ